MLTNALTCEDEKEQWQEMECDDVDEERDEVEGNEIEMEVTTNIHLELQNLLEREGIFHKIVQHLICPINDIQSITKNFLGRNILKR